MATLTKRILRAAGLAAVIATVAIGTLQSTPAPASAGSPVGTPFPQTTIQRTCPGWPDPCAQLPTTRPPIFFSPLDPAAPAGGELPMTQAPG